MKNYISYILALFATLTLLPSCLKDDEVATSPVCTITSFTVGDIQSSYTTKINGNDTTYTRTIAGSTLLFNIDQVNGVIYSVDSLPKWANIKAVVPTVTYTGTLLVRQGGATNDYVYFSNGKDSIDFTGDVDFMVVAPDGEHTKHYSARIGQTELDHDSLYWTKVSGNLSLNGSHRTLSKDGRLYVFAQSESGTTLATSTANGTKLTWTSPQPLDADINYKSVTLFNDSFFGIASDNKVYTSDDGLQWTATTSMMERLLATDSRRLYAFDGTSLQATADGINWEQQPAENLTMLPEMPVSSVAYKTKTNSQLENFVMMGTNPNANYSVAWYKISSVDNYSDQSWNYIAIGDDNQYGMPPLENVQMVRYNGKLIAIGGKATTGSLKAYSYIYASDDNGVTWHIPTSGMSMEESLIGTTQPVTMTVCDGCIWLVQVGGQVWRGIMSNSVN